MELELWAPQPRLPSRRPWVVRDDATAVSSAGDVPSVRRRRARWRSSGRLVHWSARRGIQSRIERSGCHARVYDMLW